MEIKWYALRWTIDVFQKILLRRSDTLRAVAVGRKNWTFAGSDEGGRRAAIIYSLIATCLCRARHRAV